MHRLQRESFVIQVRGGGSSEIETFDPQTSPHHHPEGSVYSSSSSGVSSGRKLNFSSMKLFNRFRKIVMRLVFSYPSSRGSSSGMSSSGASKQRSTCERFDPPKTSCSSYYSSHSHYSEAIADCIEFLNKSSQDGILDGRKSDVLV